MDIDVENEAFNTCVTKCRVVNEHCIGVLKSRWHSLKHLRTQLNFKKYTTFMIRWIFLYAKLHNYVMTLNNEWMEVDDEIELESAVEPLGPTPKVSRAG